MDSNSTSHRSILNHLSDGVYIVDPERKIVDWNRAARITASLGGAPARPDEGIAALVERADRGQYRSKASGRNRVAIGGEMD